jgi:hypothetical protein
MVDGKTNPPTGGVARALRARDGQDGYCFVPIPDSDFLTPDFWPLP